MTDDIKTQFRQEGEPAFQAENTETDNSADSSKEKTDTDQAGSSDQQDKKQTDTDDKDGKDAGLADHPRWKEREDDWKQRFNDQEERHTKELESLRQEIDEKIKPKGDIDSKIPSWFGGDEEQWAEYQRHEEARLAQAEERAVKRLSSQEEQKQKAIDTATKYFQDEVVTIETDKDLNPDGQKVDRNKLLKTAMDFDLVDSKGRWNYRAAWQFMKNSITRSKADSTEERKKIASATTSDNKAETKPESFRTPKDFQGKSWGDL